jgi:hypothetical protein
VKNSTILVPHDESGSIASPADSISISCKLTSRRFAVTGIRQTRGSRMKGNMMNLRDASTLRTRLRQVNLEYSALVRERSGEGRFVRMDELRAERKALMALIAAGATGVRRPLVSRQQPQYSSLQTDKPASIPANRADTAAATRLPGSSLLDGRI